MCGIAGLLGAFEGGPTSPADRARAMISALVHRGPDASGVWSDATSGVALGSRRLAILDVSDAGRQPMASVSGRYVVVLNGEIYNHRDLRERLAAEGRAPAWHGSSDTEVLTACIDAWGIEKAAVASVGMFAMAIWDRAERTLALVRDRIGEKPLHYGRFRGTWLFGSELKALQAHPFCDRSIDPEAFAGYLALGYVPGTRSIHRRIAKVGPGCIVRLRADDDRVDVTVYWSALGVASRPRLAFADDAAAIDALDAMLVRAVDEQMIADRPLGALLSGGVDSSTIVALMAARRPSQVQTFSIGFRESAYNEAHHAARIARYLGTTHTELYIGADDIRDTIPRLPTIHDEPFADISLIPTFLVSQLASRAVTVALTGDGGDELFGGYPRYAMGARLWSAVRRVPRRWRPLLGDALGRAPAAIDRLFSHAFPHDEASGVRGLRPAQKLGKLGRALKSGDADALYWQLLAPWGEALGTGRRAGVFPDRLDLPPGLSLEEAFMLRDLVGYLPDDILAKIDRASMAVSLESRAPMLDHRVVEFALGLPHRMKIRGDTGKWLLRQVLHRYVPPELVDRPKMGFVIPIASWLRGPLKPWAYDLIASSRGEAAELLDLPAVRRLLDRHATGVGDWHQPLWTALMFLNWAHGEAVPAIAGAAPFEVAPDVAPEPVQATLAPEHWMAAVRA